MRACSGLPRQWRPRLQNLRAKGWRVCWRDGGQRRFICPPLVRRSLPPCRDKRLAQRARSLTLPAGARRSRAAERRSPRPLKPPLRHKRPPNRTPYLGRGTPTPNKSFSDFKKVARLLLTRRASSRSRAHYRRTRQRESGSAGMSDCAGSALFRSHKHGTRRNHAYRSLVLRLQRCLNRVCYPLPKDRVAVCGGGSATPADVGDENRCTGHERPT